MKEIKEGAHYPFEKTTALNIGNPQALGQSYVSYNREIMAAMTYPPLARSSLLSQDAKERVRFL